ncbi:MAG TPA: CaiB/BaiF CoA-transferase family protein [Candidatus Limnocylindria bacterium]
MSRGSVREATGPLRGIRVLELGNFVAAPTAGRLLAEFGAEVIKIELPRVGDEVRSWRLLKGNTSMMWRAMARNKKSVTVDLRTPEGAALILSLVEHVDVVVENYRPGKLESWGLAPDVMRERNPALVVVRISGYGQTGPYRDRPGFGSVAESMGGIRYVTGYEDRPPTRMNISIGDTLAGMYGVIGALMGLLARERGLTTRGETVDVALTEAVFSVMESMVPEFSAYGVVRERAGNFISGVAPSGTYPCREGAWVVIGGNSDGIFRRFMTAIGRADLANDPRMRDNPGRAANGLELNDAISEWTRAHSVDEVMEVMTAANVPAGPIYSVADLMEDPHFKAREMFIEREVPVDGGPQPVIFPGVVPKLEQMPGAVRWSGPELGEHTREVLGGILGLSDSELAELEQRRVV